MVSAFTVFFVLTVGSGGVRAGVVSCEAKRVKPLGILQLTFAQY